MSTVWVRLMAYVIAAAVLIGVTWVVAMNVIARDNAERITFGEERAVQLTTFFEAETLKTLTIADNFIRETRRNFLKYRRYDDLIDFFEEAVPNKEFVSHMMFIGPDGSIKALTGGNPPRDFMRDDPYFLMLRENTDDQVYILPSDQGHVTGRLTFGLMRRVELPDGSFAGAILAAVSADQFTDFFRTVHLGPGSSASLLGLDGLILARSSYGFHHPGQGVAGSPLWEHLQKSSIGQYFDTSPVDGAKRYHAYRQLAEFPLVVSIDVAHADLIQGASGFDRVVYVVASLTSAVIAVLIATLCLAEIARQRLQQENAVRQLTERELEAANLDLTQFAYSASHDLKAPLSSIDGLLEFCLEDLEDGELDEVRTNMQEAREISQRAARKVESLLRLARVGKRDVPDEEFSLEAMVRDIWKDQTALIDSRCRLEVDIKGDRTVCTERTTMQVIIENIVSNALRYRDEEKDETLISVKAQTRNNETHLVIGDNGVGIAEKDQVKVFEMFKRFDNRSGDGLGLALVKKSVESLGATLNLMSEVGEGTQFTIVFKNSEGKTV